MLQKAGMLVGCLGAFVVVAALALYVLARRAPPLPTIGETLASLPEAERATLSTICGLTGLAPDALRPVGAASAYVFAHESNRAAVHVRDGHVRGLCLRGRTFTSVPDFRALASLESLWLVDGSLGGWPDLSTLSALTDLQLGGQKLGTPPVGALPASLRTLGLQRTAVDDVAPLATLGNLQTLDLSDTPVTSFAALVSLKLDALDLARTKVSDLPGQLPWRSAGARLGAWKVDLTDTPVTNPPGFSWKGPGGYSFAGTALGNETRSGGPVGRKVVTGSGSEVPALRPVELPTARGGPESIGPVVVEASVATGKARVWMNEPPGWFSSPWFTEGHVEGFGFARRSGFVFVDVPAGETRSLRGNLMLPGPIEHHDFRFLVEPLDGTKVTGLRYRVSPSDS